MLSGLFHEKLFGPISFPVSRSPPPSSYLPFSRSFSLSQSFPWIRRIASLIRSAKCAWTAGRSMESLRKKTPFNHPPT